MEQSGYGTSTAGNTTNEVHNAGLTTSELHHLWNNYVDSSAIICLITSFSTQVGDQEIQALLSESLDILNKRQQMVTNIMQKENMPIPIGFSVTEDVDLKAPRLYTDVFYLSFLRFMQRFEIPLGGLDFVTSTRSDMLDYYDYRMTSSIMIFKKITDTALRKGVYVRPPYVAISRDINMAKDNRFLAGYFNKTRPLLAQEVSSLYNLIQPNLLGKFVLTGFRQTARSKQVHNYMDWGIKLGSQLMDTFGSKLEEEDVQVPTIWDTMVTDSTVPPFSEKLMMFALNLFGTCGITMMAYALKNCFRHDVKVSFLKMMPEINEFYEEGIKIRIKNGWFEEPPRIVDRRELVNDMMN